MRQQWKLEPTSRATTHVKGTDRHRAPRSRRDGEDTEPPGRRQGKQALGTPLQSVLSCSSGHPLSPGPHLVGGPAPPGRAWADCCTL